MLDQQISEVGANDQRTVVAHATSTSMSLRPDTTKLCAELKVAQRRRRFAIGMQSRCDRAVEGFIRTACGFNTKLPEAERKKIVTKAIRVQKLAREAAAKAKTIDTIWPRARAIARDTGVSVEDVVIIMEIITTNDQGRAGWDRLRAEAEAEMVKLARQLPVYDWAMGVRGFADKGLAVLVAETGDLSNYIKPSQVWKRLGLAVMKDGKIQGRVPKGLSREKRNEAWIERGYTPSRRAETFVFVDKAIVMKQIEHGVALGKYGQCFQRKKAEYLQRFANEKGFADHANKAAGRHMAKVFLRDLWRAWRAAAAR